MSTIYFCVTVHNGCKKAILLEFNDGVIPVT